MKRILSILIALLLFATTQAQIGRYPFARATASGEMYGSEMLTNGDFHDASTWVPSDASFAISTGFMVATNGSAYQGFFSTDGACISGTGYHITFTISNYTSGSLAIQCEGGGTGNGTVRAANGTYTEDVVAVSSGNIYFINGGSLANFSVDNISIRPIL